METAWRTAGIIAIALALLLFLRYENDRYLLLAIAGMGWLTFAEVTRIAKCRKND